MQNTLGSPERRCPSMKKTYKFVKDMKEVSLTEGLEVTYNWYKKYM